MDPRGRTPRRHVGDPGRGSARFCVKSPLAARESDSGATKEPSMFVELDTRHDFNFTVSLEWNRDTGETHIVVTDGATSRVLIIPFPASPPAKRFATPTGMRRERHRSRHRVPRLPAGRTGGRRRRGA